MYSLRLVRALVVLTLLAMTLGGCRILGNFGSDGSGDAGAGLQVGNAVIKGKVTQPASSNIRADIVGTAVPGARVWVENKPELFDITDENGEYTIVGLTPGTYRVVARFEKEGKIYKQRSGELTVTENAETRASELGVIEATNVVKGRLIDDQGAPFRKGTKLYLWGEEFEVLDDDGNFVTPPLPSYEEGNAIHEIVLYLGQANERRLSATFAESDPATVDFVVPSGGNSEPTDPTDPDAPAPTISVRVITYLTGSQYPPGAYRDADEVRAGTAETVLINVTPPTLPAANITWKATKGTFGASVTGTGQFRTREWTAPDEYPTDPAVITIEVTNGGKSAKAEITVPIGRRPSYFVKYNGNGHEWGAPPVDPTFWYERGNSATILGNTGNMGRSGYFEFDGWNTNADGTGTSYKAGDTVVMNQNLDLYAVWKAGVPQYGVNYHDLGKTSGNAPSWGRYPAGTVITIAGKGTLDKNGYAFGGWNSAEDGTGTDYKPGDVHTLNSQLELYPKWVTPVVITYDSNGGGGIVTIGHKYAPGDTATIAADIPHTKPGYVKAGYNTKADGTGTSYAIGYTFKIQESLYLYTMWTPE